MGTWHVEGNLLFPLGWFVSVSASVLLWLRWSVLTGHRVIVGRGSSKDAENLPSLCLASCYIPFLHYYVNGVVMAVCMLKNFYIKILCLKINQILGKEKKSWKPWVVFSVVGMRGHQSISISSCRPIINICGNRFTVPMEVLTHSYSLLRPSWFHPVWHHLHLSALSTPQNSDPQALWYALGLWFTIGRTK